VIQTSQSKILAFLFYISNGPDYSDCLTNKILSKEEEGGCPQFCLHNTEKKSQKDPWVLSHGMFFFVFFNVNIQVISWLSPLIL
jgi:hypothetical protein